MAGIIDNEKAEMPTLTEFTEMQSTYSDCRAAFLTIEKPNTRFNVDSDGVLVRIAP